MGNSSDTTYAVEFSWFGRCEIVADGFKTQEIAETYIIGRANKQGMHITDYRVMPCGVKAKPSPVKGDMKEGLTGGKPLLSEIPHAPLVYAARGFEYGHSPGKYERGNYLRPQIDMLADFHRMQFYLDAVFRHGTKLTTEMNRVLGCGDGTPSELMAAAATKDTESGLPHLTGMLANLMMLVQQAVDAGLLPADPGQPWLKKTQTA